MARKPNKLFCVIDDFDTLFEKVAAKKLTTYEANERLEALLDKRVTGTFLQIPLSAPEGNKAIWMQYMRVWLNLRSPSWRYRPYEGACCPVTSGSSDKTIRRTAEHIEGLIALHRLEPPRSSWMEWNNYLERGAGILRDKLDKPVWQLGQR